MRSGPDSPGEAARLFLLRRLQAGPVAVARLEAEAKDMGISRRTLYRAAKRLGLVNRRAWALPAEQSAPQQATVEAEEQAVAVEAQRQAAVVETDRRVEQAVAKVNELIAGGMLRDIAIYRRVCRDNPELAARVREKLAREAADERVSKVRDRMIAAGVTVTPEVDERLRQIAARSAQAEVNR